MRWTEDAGDLVVDALRWVPLGIKQALAVELREELIDSRLRGVADWDG